MHDDDRRILELFNEKVGKLDRYSFTKFLRENQLGYSLQLNAAGTYDFSLAGPSEEATDAFALTLRMFIQNKDPISFAKLDDLYRRLPITEHLKLQYSDSRSRLNEFLDGPSVMVIKGVRLSNREILDAFLYGLLAHLTPRHRKTIETWASDRIQFQVMQMVFFSILAEVLRFAIWVHEHNLLAFAELDSPQPQSSNEEVRC